MESLMSGPHASCILNCLSQNPDLAAQMLLSHPIFSGNVQLQHPEVLAVMLNPRVTEALLQIQKGLQILAEEAPSLIPHTCLSCSAELCTGGAGVNATSDARLSSQSGSSDQVAKETERQQQQFVRELLKALANTNNQEEVELQEELENSTGFRDRQMNF
uniref:Ubiquilin-like n=1 Tax=Nothobranchius furzeri TaxID=105023 RepID=A0A8C6MKZ3_NOTFU